MHTLKTVAFAVALTVASRPASAQNASVAYYFDARTYPTLAVQTSWSTLPAGLSFWGFTDLHGAQHTAALEITRYFMEYRVSQRLVGGLGWQVEYNDFAGPGNSMARVGATLRHDFLISGANGWLQWRFFPLETNAGGQASVIFNVSAARWGLSGFADVNWQPYAWVVEPQIFYRATDRYTLLLELRHNDYEAEALDPTGVAFGIRVEL